MLSSICSVVFPLLGELTAACGFSELVDVSMSVHATPAPVVPVSAEMSPAPLPEVVNKILPKDVDSGNGASEALIGGVVGAVLLALVCLVVALLWYLSRHKG
ncbi:cell adhesion molecule 2-like [Xiphias gladius]|uniref:cell adhesion molecule 2-like n=1 Tax=Xiphias gladius TaxID=8245 RepID=UPI001A98C2A2|nr:cell adhesion molecule 2-like [Xiphias gladius]